MSEFTISKTIGASVESVFEFFTSSEMWSRWQGRSTTIDARPGGVFRMVAPNNGVALGEILEMVPNQRIVFSWGWEGHPTVPPGSSTVTIEFIPDGEETLVNLTHRGLPDDEVGLHQSGWMHYLGRLADVSVGRVPGPDKGIG